MSDKYNSFRELSESERDGRDYRIRCVPRNSNWLIIAPHGGGIEPGTSEIAESIAGIEYSFYSFEGIKPKNNCDLHITSDRFDETQAIALARAHHRILAIHGKKGQDSVIEVGGSATNFRSLLVERLIGHFPNSLIAPHPRGGVDPNNICNQGRKNGLQLEIARDLRDSDAARSQIASIVREFLTLPATA